MAAVVRRGSIGRSISGGPTRPGHRGDDTSALPALPAVPLAPAAAARWVRSATSFSDWGPVRTVSGNVGRCESVEQVDKELK